VVGQPVPGSHSWLLADPDAFGRAMADPVARASAGRQARLRLAGDSTSALWRGSNRSRFEAEFPHAANE
jgi:hypothetical protein